MINVMRMRHIRGVGEFDRCSIINSLMEKYFTHIGINFICVKFIKTISKIFGKYIKYFIIRIYQFMLLKYDCMKKMRFRQLQLDNEYKI